MSWQIAKRQLLLNLMTFRFAVATAVCVLLVALLVPILIEDYRARLENYSESAARNADELRKVMAYRNIQPTVYRAPPPLSVFSEGVESQFENSAKIELGSVPEMGAAPIDVDIFSLDFRRRTWNPDPSETSADIDPFLSIFPGLDVSLVFGAVISILALLVAFDAVSGERERGTLKLMLAAPVARHHVLIGKLISGLLTLLIPITIAFIVTALMLELSPVVELNGSDWARIGLMYVASLIFVAAMFNIGLFFSALTRRSSTSLMFSLFAWVCFVAIIPNVSVYVATQVVSPDSKEEADAEIKSLRGEWERERREYGGVSGASSDAEDAFGGHYMLLCSRNVLEWNQGRNALLEPLKIQYAEKAAQVQRGYSNSLLKQKALADNLSRISPVSVYRAIMSALAGTDVASVKHFFDGVKAQRAQVIEYIRSKTDGFSTPTYFARWNEKASEEFSEAAGHGGGGGRGERGPSRAERAQRWTRITELREEALAKLEPLDLSDLPSVTPVRESVRGTARRVFPNLLISILVGAVFFAAAFAAFMRYDIRQD